MNYCVYSKAAKTVSTENRDSTLDLFDFRGFCH
jgi:hypothetical protein